MNDDEKLILQLGIKGIPPGEATRVIQMSAAELQAEIRKANDAIFALHKKLEDAKTEETRKATEAQIKAEQKRGQAYIKLLGDIEREEKRAANASQTNWRRMLADMSHLTTVAGGMKAGFSAVVGTIESAAKALFQFADDADRVAKVYGSLKGSVEGASAALGDVSKYDLILARNRALEMGLELTDEQFTQLAQGADAFADAMGLQTKEALDKLITGITTGNERILKRVGVLGDLKKAQEEWAADHAIYNRELTEEEKATANLDAALTAINAKMKESGAVSEGMAKRLLDLRTSLENTKNAALAAAGGFSDMSLGAKRAAAASALAQLQGLGRDADPGAVRALQEEIARLDKEWTKGRLEKLSATAAAIGKEAGADQLAATGGEMPGGSGAAGFTGAPSYDPKIAMRNEKAAASRAASRAVSAANRIKEMIKAYDAIIAPIIDANLAKREQVGRVAATDDELESLMAPVAERSADVIERTQKEVADRLAGAHADIKVRTGGGMLGQLLLGDVDRYFDQLDEWEKATVDSVGMVQESLEGMKEAAGAALYAMAAGENFDFGKATRAIINNLGAQSMVKAVFNLAEAAAAYAIGDVPAAVKFGQAAALYGSIGLGAGLLNRAVGSVSGGTSRPGTTSLPTQPIRGAGGGGRSDGGGDGEHLVLNITALPGTEADIGRKIIEYIEAHKRKTGRAWN